MCSRGASCLLMAAIPFVERYPLSLRNFTDVGRKHVHATRHGSYVVFMPAAFPSNATTSSRRQSNPCLTAASHCTGMGHAYLQNRVLATTLVCEMRTCKVTCWQNSAAEKRANKHRNQFYRARGIGENDTLSADNVVCTDEKVGEE